MSAPHGDRPSLPRGVSLLAHQLYHRPRVALVMARCCLRTESPSAAVHLAHSHSPCRDQCKPKSTMPWIFCAKVLMINWIPPLGWISLGRMCHKLRRLLLSRALISASIICEAKPDADNQRAACMYDPFVALAPDSFKMPGQPPWRASVWHMTKCEFAHRHLRKMGPLDQQSALLENAKPSWKLTVRLTVHQGSEARALSTYRLFALA